MLKTITRQCMHGLAFMCIMTLSLNASAESQHGMVKIASPHDVATTLDRMESKLKEKGMTIFTRIDHAAGARKAGEVLRPTQLLIFGNPKVGTPLMQCKQSIALDLPQKALAWKDAKGQVWLAYNDPAYIAERHQLKDCMQATKKVSGALAKFSSYATAPSQ